MGCTKCKDKKVVNGDTYKDMNKNETKILFFFIVWSLFAIYGVISLIKDIF